MIVKLYKSTAESIVVDKSSALELVANKNCTLLKECSVLSPVLLLEELSDADKVRECNYLYIEDFNRYYYINKIDATRKLWTISASCDVLMSFKSDIKASTGIVARQQKKYHKGIADNTIKLYQKPYYLHRHKGFEGFKYASNDGYVLAVAGGTQ